MPILKDDWMETTASPYRYTVPSSAKFEIRTDLLDNGKPVIQWTVDPLSLPALSEQEYLESVLGDDE